MLDVPISMPFSRLGKLAQAIVHSRTAPSGRATDRGAVGSDVSLNEDVTIGDLALEWLTTSYGRENGGETINRCERILQLLAPSEDGLSLWQPVVLTTDGVLALTAPGRAIYVTVGLLQMIGAKINRLLFSPEQEYAADRDGLARCHRAGFDLTRCITLFDVLARWVDSGRELGVNFAGDWLGDSTPFRAWLRERISGYPTLAERRAAAEVERTLLESGHA